MLNTPASASCHVNWNTDGGTLADDLTQSERGNQNRGVATYTPHHASGFSLWKALWRKSVSPDSRGKSAKCSANSSHFSQRQKRD